MRRCPSCQAPNPERATDCASCGQALPAIPIEPWLRRDDLLSLGDLKRALPPLALWMAFRLSFGRLLTAGAEREELRFLAFHLMNGALLGLCLAWMRREERWMGWAPWLGAGLAGGLLAEALEAWYTYRHLMGTLTLYIWRWFEWPATAALVYQLLQGLRLAGLVAPLLLLGAREEKRFARMAISVLGLLLGVALRMPVRGAFLTWRGLLDPGSWGALAAYAASCGAVLLALGRRPLTKGASHR